jgi:hypothetical protein
MKYCCILLRSKHVVARTTRHWKLLLQSEQAAYNIDAKYVGARLTLTMWGWSRVSSADTSESNCRSCGMSMFPFDAYSKRYQKAKLGKGEWTQALGIARHDGQNTQAKSNATLC